MTDKDYYAILEVSRDASTSEIKRAYRRLARRYHPDLHPGDKFDEEMFKAINEAYEVLSDPVKRQEYGRLQEELSIRREYYPDVSRTEPKVRPVDKKQTNKPLDRLFGWMGQMGFGWFLLAAILLIMFLLPAISYLFGPERDIRGVDCLIIDNTTFKEEVLESPIPVLVVFCTDKEWNRDADPDIVALKRIIKKGDYEYIIKFCRFSHYVQHDPTLKEFAWIGWWNEMMIVTNGNIFRRFHSMENIEHDLQQAVDSM